MQQKLLKKIKQLPFKLLIIIGIVLTILVTLSFFFINSKGLSLNTTNSKLLNLTRQEETENQEDYSKNNNEEDNLATDNNENSTTPEEEKENNNQPNITDANSQTTSDKEEEDTQKNNEENDDNEQDEEIPEPEPEQPETPSAYVAFYADNQSDSDEDDQNHQRVVNYILNSGTNPIFHAGDVMEDGTQDSLDRFNSVTSTLRSTRTFYAALGNNDRKVGDSTTPSQLFLDNFIFPNNERWYSVNYGNLHMIILDSAFASTSTSQINWLVTDLQSSNSQNRITGVMFHHPSFANTIATYLVNNNADFIISGHLHSYNHYTTSGIDQFVLSGQPNIGYMIGRVYSDKIVLTAYNSSNNVIQTVTVNDR
jgi:predicted phosphodiesterase